jgi:hypothetical protein
LKFRTDLHDASYALQNCPLARLACISASITSLPSLEYAREVPLTEVTVDVLVTTSVMVTGIVVTVEVI